MRIVACSLVLKCLGFVISLKVLVTLWILLTASGSSTSLNALQDRFNSLEYDYSAGTLLTGLHLKQVRWQLKNKTIVSSPNLKFRWSPKCWYAKKLCISEISADQLVIDVPNGGESGSVKTLSAVELPISIFTKTLNIDEVIINNVGQSPLIFHHVEFSGNLEGKKLTADQLKLDWLWLRANLSGTMSLHENYPITANGTLVSTDPGLALPIKSHWLIGGDLLSLQLNADLDAPYQGKLAGTYSTLRPGLPANIKVSWPTAAWPRLDKDPQVFVDKGELLISGIGPDYKTRATAVVHGRDIPKADIVLDGKMNARKATFFPLILNTLGGELAAEGVFKWHNGLSWNTSLTADELWPDLYWPQLQGLLSGTAHFSGRTHNSKTTLALDSIVSSGTLHGHQFKLTGNAAKDAEGNWHLSAVQAKNRDNQLYANGTIGKTTDLELNFKSRSVEDLVNGVRGDAHINLQIAGDIQKPDINGAVSSANMKIGDISLKNTKLKGIIEEGGYKQSEIIAVSNTIKAHSQELRGVTFQLSGNRAEHIAQASFKHKLGGVNQLRIEGSLRKSSDWQGQVTNARGLLFDHPITLQKAFSMRWVHDKQSLLLDPHCWSLDLADTCITNTALVGKSGNISFAVNSLKLDDLQPPQEAPFTLNGLLNTRGKLHWAENRSPSVDLSGNVSGATVALVDVSNSDKIKIPLDSVKINVATKDSLVKADLHVNAKQFGSANAQLDIDTSSPDYPVTGSLALSNNNIGWLYSFMPDSTSLTGKVSADAVVGGTLGQPVVNGVVSVNNGALSSPLLPIDLDKIGLDIAFNNAGSHISGSAMSANTPVQIKGTSLQGAKGWSTDINIRADRLKIDTDFFRNAVVSPDLDIYVADSGVRIDGNLDVHRADIVVNDLAPGGVATSSDVVIVDASAAEKQKTPAIKQNFASEIDVSLGRRVRFSGYGLKADLSGDFQLALDAKRPPELLGEIKVDNGTYRSYGQNLLIRDGRITFLGPLQETAVTVEAVREVDNILAGLRVDGSLQNPKTTLFSEPSLPKEEILSYVVLGRSLEFGSTDDSQMLTNAALFMGISNGRSFSQNIAENLGIEDFYLTSTGTGDETQVMLSGRINNRLLVRYGVGVFNAVSTLFLRYDLAEQLYIETTQGLERAIDIFYSFEF